MPGPKRQGVRPAQPNEPLISVLDTETEDLECPSTEGYVTAKKVKTKTIEGIVEDTEYAWTKRGLERWLKDCPKKLVFIKTDDLNDGTDITKMAPHPVSIDGYRFEVSKGVPVWVPKPIADIIEQSQQPFRTSQAVGIDLYKIEDTTLAYGGQEFPALGAAG
jgi:hypothetical protein